MSITLAPRDRTMDDIDTELDRFNDAMNVLGYEAGTRQGAWGETVIEVFTDAAEPIAEFWSDTPGFLDDFRAYSNDLIDATSITRSKMKEAMAA